MASADRGRDLLVAVEGRVARPAARLGLGLAHIVEEGGQAQDELGRGGVDAGVEVIEHVEDVHAPLLHAAAGGELGLISARGPSPRGGGGPSRAYRREEYLLQLVADPLGRDHAESVDRGPDRGQGRGLDLEAQLGGEADSAQGPEPVLAEALERVAHGPNEAASEVLAASVGIEEASCSARSKAIALIVKSRRERSSSIVEANSTSSGCRPSA